LFGVRAGAPDQAVVALTNVVGVPPMLQPSEARREPCRRESVRRIALRRAVIRLRDSSYTYSGNGRGTASG
jgi:hypothetical protein